MLINLTNHPYSAWDENQKKAAEQFGECTDLPFPPIDPTAGNEEVEALADEYLHKITTMVKEDNAQPVVHLMGEMTFLFALANKLKENGIRCVASTSERSTTDMGNGQKTITFKFVRFRDYYDCT